MPTMASELQNSQFKYLELDRQGAVVLYGRIRRYNGQQNWVVCEHGAHPINDADSADVRVYHRPDEGRAEFTRAISRAQQAAAAQVRYEDVPLATPVEASTPAPARRRRRTGTAR
jgi:hypothetical protein